jgi:hypothetical protein
MFLLPLTIHLPVQKVINELSHLGDSILILAFAMDCPYHRFRAAPKKGIRMGC